MQSISQQEIKAGWFEEECRLMQEADNLRLLGVIEQNVQYDEACHRQYDEARVHVQAARGRGRPKGSKNKKGGSRDPFLTIVNGSTGIETTSEAKWRFRCRNVLLTYSNMSHDGKPCCTREEMHKFITSIVCCTTSYSAQNTDKVADEITAATTAEEVLAAKAAKATECRLDVCIVQAAVALENHRDGTPHFHVAGRFNYSPDTTNVRAYDFPCKRHDLGYHHPNWKGFIDGGKQLSGLIVACDYVVKADPAPYMPNFKPIFASLNYNKIKSDWVGFMNDMASRHLKEWPVDQKLYLYGKESFFHIDPTTYRNNWTTMKRRWGTDPKKQRHFYIHGGTTLGKSATIKETLKGYKYFVPGKKNVNYPWDGYDGENIIYYDDYVPSFEEISYVSEMHDNIADVPGSQRYYTKKFPSGQIRVIIIVDNHPPSVYFTNTTDEGEQNPYNHLDAIKARFHIINLTKEKNDEFNDLFTDDPERPRNYLELQTQKPEVVEAEKTEWVFNPLN